MNGQDVNRLLIDIYNATRHECGIFHSAVNSAFGKGKFSAYTLESFYGLFIETLSDEIAHGSTGALS